VGDPGFEPGTSSLSERSGVDVCLRWLSDRQQIRAFVGLGERYAFGRFRVLCCHHVATPVILQPRPCTRLGLAPSQATPDIRCDAPKHCPSGCVRSFMAYRHAERRDREISLEGVLACGVGLHYGQLHDATGDA
jgi:hypothetical protein